MEYLHCVGNFRHGITRNNLKKCFLIIDKNNKFVVYENHNKQRLFYFKAEHNSIKDLIIIEILFGNILSEDDIIRYEDIYNRV